MLHEAAHITNLKEMFGQLGLRVDNLEARLAAVKPAVLAQRERAISAGINSTPSIFINGLAVENRSWDESSLAKLIEISKAPAKTLQASSEKPAR